MIGTRFHSVIFALNSGTPSLAIAYGGNKAYGIMQEIGLSKYVYPIEDLQPKRLVADTKFILNDNSFYLDKLKIYHRTIDESRLDLIMSIKKEL